MREVSVRMLHLTTDLARTAQVDETALTAGLRSLALTDGREPDWIDWDDFVEVVERLENVLGGAEAFGRACRAALPVAYPELRAFGSVFIRPIPLFAFTMTRFLRAMYRNFAIEEIELLGGDRVRWTQTIPEPFRASEAFHRKTASMATVFPCHLDLPEARIETATITPRKAEFVVAFPPPHPINARGSRAISAATSVLATQLDEAFANIGESLRSKTGRAGGPSVGKASERDVHAWAERLQLSPRQRDVFALLVEGRANKDIAGVLACSERNVEFHVGRILRAASVTSRAELLVKVLGAKP